MYYNDKIKEPKLFDVATNFLKENPELGVDKDNYRDFDILEIEFEDSDYVEKVTEGFANKYDINTKDAINVFVEPLEAKYTKEDFETLDMNFYNLGYPGSFHGKREKFNHHYNFEINSAEAGKLSNWWSQKNEADKVRGFIDTKRIGKASWAGKPRVKVGNFYVVQENAGWNLSGGSSGSMYTDKVGNLIGVKSVRGDIHSFITPLRSKQIKRGEMGNLVSPEYDLILGGKKDQLTSYRQQVQKYVLDKGNRTWLSERQWRHIS